MVLLSLVFYTLAPQDVQLYIDNRVSEVATAQDYLAAGTSNSPENSAEQRLLLISTTPRIFSENYLFGIGANKTEESISSHTGVTKLVSHNTYLEEALVGGLFGIFAVVLYIAFTAGALSRSCRAGEDTDRKAFILTLSFAFGLLCAFLVMQFLALVWLPLVLALAHLHLISNYGYSRDASPRDRR